MLTTIDDIVTDIIENRLSNEDKEFLKADNSNATLEQVWFNNEFGRWIRNHYDLWHHNPLTERWRTDPSSHDMRDGVDYSVDHPDNLSGEIISEVISQLRT